MSAALAVFGGWQRARGWLLPALQDGTESDVLADLFAGRSQLWIGEDAAMVTRLFREPEPHALVWLAGGRLQGLLAMRTRLEAWARAEGARTVRINGRLGWARVLAPYGYERVDGELRKAL